MVIALISASALVSFLSPPHSYPQVEARAAHPLLAGPLALVLESSAR